MMMGSLDDAPGTTGLLIVSGGNEIRCGAHRGMALIAGEIAALGHPVFRYDRRGIGDSAGTNTGFLGARDDLIAATAAFRAAMPTLNRIVGVGNCDAATTLALFGRDAAIDRLLLANPWTVGETDDLPPAAAIRNRYAARLRQPAEWWRLITGGVDLSKLISGLKKVSARRSEDSFAGGMLDAIASWGNDATIILADGDATAIAFSDAARKAGRRFITEIVGSDSHSFARASDSTALLAAIGRTMTTQPG